MQKAVSAETAVSGVQSYPFITIFTIYIIRFRRILSLHISFRMFTCHLYQFHWEFFHQNWEIFLPFPIGNGSVYRSLRYIPEKALQAFHYNVENILAQQPANHKPITFMTTVCLRSQRKQVSCDIILVLTQLNSNSPRLLEKFGHTLSQISI